MVTQPVVKSDHKAKDIASGIYARRLEIALILIVFIFSFSVRYVNITDIGITVDEPAYVHAGIIYVNNILHANFNSNAYSSNMEHPPVSKYLYGMAIWAFNGGKEDYNAYVIAKTVSAILGAATCVLVFFIGREFFCNRTAFLSAMILALIPDFLAHTQIAALDGLVTFFFTLTLYFFMLALKTNGRRYFIASAVSLGLTVDTKFTGFMLLPIMAILFIAHRYQAVREKNNTQVSSIIYGLPLRPILAFLLIATATALIIYPWAWGGIGNIELTLRHWNQAPTEYFLGTMGPAPLYYYPVYFLVTTPALLFLPLALGIVMVLRSRDPFKYAILLWFIVPFAYDLSYFKQDGMRYILMIYPSVALLCGAGITAVADWIGQAFKDRRLKDIAFLAMGAVTIVYLIYVLTTISPYYLDYYNELSGGLSNAYEHKLFEVGWWGEGIHDSVMYIEHTAPPGSNVLLEYPLENVKPYIHNSSYQTSTRTYVSGDVDYFITNPTFDLYSKLVYNPSKYRLVYVTQVQGVPLARVFKKVA